MKKKVTTDLIEKYLDRLGWDKHDVVDEPNKREGMVFTGWKSSPLDDGHILTIDPMVERDYLLFRVRNLAKAPTDATPGDRLRDLLLAIGVINYRIVMGAFAYDARDGELVFKFGIPVASNDLQYEDFEHCMKTLTTNVDRYADDLLGIIEGTKTSQDVIG